MIYLVRHGEAAAHWGQHPDPELSELGQSQAEDTARKLKALGVVEAITSPMLRCRQTARAFEAYAQIHARIDPAITEITTPDNISDRKNWLAQLMQSNWADTPEDFTKWREQAFESIICARKHTAVFTHFLCINSIIGLIRKDDRVIQFKPANGSITKLEKSGRTLRLVEFGSESATFVN